jgi:DNA-binding NtrC family response regulator
VALLRIFGGVIALERGGDDGVTVRVTLPGAAPPRPAKRRSSGAPAPRARVLLVDDDVLVRIGLRRLLGREYFIVEAAGVEEALARVREHPGGIDAIVCDLVMPGGGAQRLLEELGRIEPELVAATALMTGGAVDEETQAFAEEYAERMLHKPIDVESVREMIQRVRLRRAEAQADEKEARTSGAG